MYSQAGLSFGMRVAFLMLVGGKHRAENFQGQYEPLTDRWRDIDVLIPNFT